MRVEKAGGRERVGTRQKAERRGGEKKQHKPVVGFKVDKDKK